LNERSGICFWAGLRLSPFEEKRRTMKHGRDSKEGVTCGRCGSPRGILPNPGGGANCSNTGDWNRVLAEVRGMNIFAGRNADYWNHVVARAEMKRLGLHCPGKPGLDS
jgi:hypothetical protein